MSEVPQGPGWWLASDGRWYSPDQAPGYATPSAPAPDLGPPPSAAPAGYGPPPAGYGPPPVAPPVGPPGYGYPAAPYGFTPVRKTNGLAIAAMVCSFFFWLYGIGAVLGIIFGFIARSQIKRSGGTQQGAGMALAGIIIGFVGIAIVVVAVIVLVAVVHHCEQNGTCTQPTFNSGS